MAHAAPPLGSRDRFPRVPHADLPRFRIRAAVSPQEQRPRHMARLLVRHDVPRAVVPRAARSFGPQLAPRTFPPPDTIAGEEKRRGTTRSHVHSILNYLTPRKHPPRNWFWPVVLTLVVLGAIVLVTYLQWIQAVEVMKDFD